MNCCPLMWSKTSEGCSMPTGKQLPWDFQPSSLPLFSTHPCFGPSQPSYWHSHSCLAHPSLHIPNLTFRIYTPWLCSINRWETFLRWEHALWHQADSACSGCSALETPQDVMWQSFWKLPLSLHTDGKSNMGSWRSTFCPVWVATLTQNAAGFLKGQQKKKYISYSQACIFGIKGIVLSQAFNLKKKTRVSFKETPQYSSRWLIPALAL